MCVARNLGLLKQQEASLTAKLSHSSFLKTRSQCVVQVSHCLSLQSAVLLPVTHHTDVSDVSVPLCICPQRKLDPQQTPVSLVTLLLGIVLVCF